MDLRSWLERKAGLSGRALDAAISHCEENFIDSLDDLQLASKNEVEYRQIFQQGGLRVRISAALDANKGGQDEQISQQQPKQPQISQQPSPSPAVSTQRLALPPNKKYHAFCSHKKLHSKFGDSCEVRI